MVFVRNSCFPTVCALNFSCLLSVVHPTTEVLFCLPPFLFSMYSFFCILLTLLHPMELLMHGHSVAVPGECSPQLVLCWVGMRALLIGRSGPFRWSM
ncbi:hypothetical protein BKA57DRAFT_472985 [Linnemannia elongata]|nr:hypothetical protein BKA57DRAFT_472985 [Linnemannia elongata]